MDKETCLSLARARIERAEELLEFPIGTRFGGLRSTC